MIQWLDLGILKGNFFNKINLFYPAIRSLSNNKKAVVRSLMGGLWVGTTDLPPLDLVCNEVVLTLAFVTP